MVVFIVVAVAVEVRLFLTEIVSLGDMFSEIVSLISYFCGSHCILVGC